MMEVFGRLNDIGAALYTKAPRKSWASKYVGLPFREADHPKPFTCWTLVSQVLRDQCGINIEPFAAIKSWDSPRIQEIVAAEIAREDWIRVQRSEVQEFDVVLMKVVRKLFGKETAETASHIGVVVRQRRGLHVLHIERATLSVCPRISDPSIDWRLHSFYRHRRLA